MARTTKSSTTVGKLGIGRCSALALIAGTLACALGAGVAAATGGGAEQDATAPRETTDIVTFHESIGTMFASLVEPITDDMTPAEIAANTVGTREFCLSCHSWESIAYTTLLPGDVTVYNKQGLYNVHDNHNGLVDCSECHTVEEGATAALGCVTCHYMELPEGWEGFY